MHRVPRVDQQLRESPHPVFGVLKIALSILIWQTDIFMGSGCGSVGRAVASDTRDPQFESSHRKAFIKHLFTVNCVVKTKIKKKRPGMAYFLTNIHFVRYTLTNYFHFRYSTLVP